MRVPTNTGIPTRKPQLQCGYGISSGGVARIFEGVGGTGGGPGGSHQALSLWKFVVKYSTLLRGLSKLL
jgi:hypothetical protein